MRKRIKIGDEQARVKIIELNEMAVERAEFIRRGPDLAGGALRDAIRNPAKRFGDRLSGRLDFGRGKEAVEMPLL